MPQYNNSEKLRTLFDRIKGGFREACSITSGDAKTALVFRRSSMFFNQFTSFWNFQKGEVY